MRARVQILFKESVERKKLHIFAFEIIKDVKTTIHSTIQHAEIRLTISKRLDSKRRIESRGKPKIMDTKGKRKLEVMFDQSDKVSQTQAARSFKCSQQYICKTLKKYTSIRKRQKIVIPLRSEGQKPEARMWKIVSKFQKLKLDYQR